MDVGHAITSRVMDIPGWSMPYGPMSMESQIQTPGDDALGFGQVLKRRREARRMSQLDLALTCDVSARHISFLESGRAAPSRAMVLKLASGLLMPRSATNALLTAAGFAAVYPITPMDAGVMEPFRAMLAFMMARHEPFPTILCDRHWNVRDASPSAMALLSVLDPGDGEVNLIRLITSVGPVTDVVVNLPEVLVEMRNRMQLEALEAGHDPELEDLVGRLEAACLREGVGLDTQRRNPLVPLTMTTPYGQLSFLSAIAHFGTSEDVSIRDLRLELMFPADDFTRQVLENPPWG